MLPPEGVVLVVDDLPDTLRMLTDALSQAGMTVLVALEGSQALAIAERVTPDIILMDAILPRIDGFETTRRLKSHKTLTHVPVIFMTGLTETEDIVKGLEAGGVDYVTKPINPDELLARIRVHLSNARLAHSARNALDASGRHLLAIDSTGKVLWCTPHAADLLGRGFQDFQGTDYVLPVAAQKWLHERNSSAGRGTAESIVLETDSSFLSLRLTYVGNVGAQEILLRLTEGESQGDEAVLKRKLQLTQRESEVLMWIARGKSNRDIADILVLSPRTVNKHLEQIFTKLGVENRASAAALAVRALRSD